MYPDDRSPDMAALYLGSAIIIASLGHNYILEGARPKGGLKSATIFPDPPDQSNYRGLTH